MTGPNRAYQTAEVIAAFQKLSLELTGQGTPEAAITAAHEAEYRRRAGAQRAENGVQALRGCHGVKSELAALYGAKNRTA